MVYSPKESSVLSVNIPEQSDEYKGSVSSLLIFNAEDCWRLRTDFNEVLIQVQLIQSLPFVTTMKKKNTTNTTTTKKRYSTEF